MKKARGDLFLEAGEDIFEQGKGHLWGIWETPDYMRARFALVESVEREHPSGCSDGLGPSAGHVSTVPLGDYGRERSCAGTETFVLGVIRNVTVLLLTPEYVISV